MLLRSGLLERSELERDTLRRLRRIEREQYEQSKENIDVLAYPADAHPPEAALTEFCTVNNAAVDKMKAAQVVNLTEAPGAIVTYDTFPWVYLLVGIDVVAGAFILFMAAAIFRRRKDNKLHPEKYRAA